MKKTVLEDLSVRDSFFDWIGDALGNAKAAYKSTDYLEKAGIFGTGSLAGYMFYLPAVAYNYGGLLSSTFFIGAGSVFAGLCADIMRFSYESRQNPGRLEPGSAGDTA